ncbi:aldo/keto reductase [Catenulispora acidiphila DSM 44928]|uniref:Aldo/keto reductase n=1 Tax=Catenulispora acidiphila (strain DSM 44928 / JCM 14897 / NBRC 102108 / NRRL B-24433 / ID139908) TaxID=479433 RepID=C7Q7N7_CATAD|nr:aldo/keto reductase [Catenulispora acidiphila]ACU72230.1 aldo/keto reductase [Catenulispora acidiphila DSM 44928]
MPVRQLGGLRVPAQGLGCMGLSEFRGPVEPGEALRAVHRALDMGVTMLDTADIYGLGHNESLVGRAVRGRRDQAVIATKCGIVRGRGEAGRRLCGTRRNIKESCERSLARLGVDHIDLFYLHRVDPDTPIEESMLGMAELIAEGKIWYVGLSEAGPETIRRAHAVVPITALQSEWSLFSREVEGEALGVCRELGIGVVAFSPLARGLLSGGIRRLGDLSDRDERRINPRFHPGNFDRNMRLVAALEDVAARMGITVAQLALAWVHHQGPDVVPIPGAEHASHVADNVKAASVTLGAEDLALLERLSPAEAVAGHRMDAVRSGMLPAGKPHPNS